MKFTHDLKFNKAPDWKDQYVDYWHLKKLIYKNEQTATQRTMAADPERQRLLQTMRCVGEPPTASSHSTTMSPDRHSQAFTDSLQLYWCKCTPDSTKACRPTSDTLSQQTPPHWPYVCLRPMTSWWLAGDRHLSGGQPLHRLLLTATSGGQTPTTCLGPRHLQQVDG